MPFEDRVQAIISSVDEGCGQILLRVVIALLVIGGLFTYFAYDQFRGLQDAGAMEMAQLGRNHAAGRGFTTRCLRPFDLAHLEGRGFDSVQDEMPDVRNAPMYPAVLSACFRMLRPSFDVAAGWRLYRPESKVLVPLGGVLILATALVIYFVARALFDGRSAPLAVIVFAVTESVLATAMSGTQWMLASLLVSATFGAVLLAVGLRRRHVVLCLIAAFFGGVFCGLSILTAYSLFVIAPGALLLLCWGLEHRRWSVFLCFVAALGITLTPWLLRNQAVSGSLLGLAPYTALEESALFTSDSLERKADVAFRRGLIPVAMKMKIAENLHRMHERHAFPLYGGLVFCLFVAAIFYRYEEDDANRLKWCALLTLPLLHVAAALNGQPAMLIVAFPLVLVLGVGFYFALEDQMEFLEIGVKRAIAALLVLACAGPAVLTVWGVPARRPYPPYGPPFIAYVSSVLEEEEAISTDIPWATAWYGGKRSILLPEDPQTLVQMRENGWRIGGIYLTSQTGDKAYIAELAEGPEQAWLPLLDRKVPEGFPWAYGVAIPPGSRSQLLLTDRERW